MPVNQAEAWKRSEIKDYTSTSNGLRTGGPTKNSTLELKGYFQAPQDGWYVFENQNEKPHQTIEISAPKSTQFYMWLSSEITQYDLSEKSTASGTSRVWKRYGVSDQKITSRDGSIVSEEYFKTDGYASDALKINDQDAYMTSTYYHHDNAVAGENNYRSHTITPVYLLAGEKYFVRVMAGGYQSELDLKLVFKYGAEVSDVYPASTSFGEGYMTFTGTDITTCQDEVTDTSGSDDGEVVDDTTPDDPVNPGPSVPDSPDECYGTPIGQVFSVSDYRTGDISTFNCTAALAECINEPRLGFGGGENPYYVVTTICGARPEGTNSTPVETPFMPSTGAEPDPDLWTYTGGTIEPQTNTGSVNCATDNPYRQAPGPGSSAYIRRLRAGETEAGIKRENDQWWKWRVDNGCVQGGLTFGGGSSTNSDGSVTIGGLTFTGGSGYDSSYLFGNYVGLQKPEMTGFNFYPSVFKRKTKKLVKPAEDNGYTFSTQGSIPLGKVNGPNTQRVSGGYIVPLAQPLLRTVSKTPRVLRNFEISDEPWGDNFTAAGNSFTYEPKRIGGTININGSQVQNVKSSAFNQLNFAGPAVAEPDTQGGSLPVGTTELVAQQAQQAIPVEFEPLTSAIRYTTLPIVEITPLTTNTRGDNIPAGPTVQASITRPAPSVTITSQGLLETTEGEELYINGQRVVIRSRTLEDIKTQVNCGPFGLDAKFVNDDTELLISSCSGQAWRVANGCGGGTYKQVGDFHINRGFEQSKTINQTVSDVTVNPFSTNSVTTGTVTVPLSNAGIQTGTAEESYNLSSGMAPQGTSTNSDSASGNPVSKLERYIFIEDANPLLEDINGERYIRGLDNEKIYPGMYVQNGRQGSTVGYTTNPEFVRAASSPKYKNSVEVSTPSIVPMVSNSVNTQVQLGGSGYRVGDRLRLIGGTPVPSPKAPLTKVCIDSAGAGYTDITKLQVLINPDGTAPGVGASAYVDELDLNGGIANITVLNQGSGYDLNNPPTIEIIDTNTNAPAPITIDSRWPGDIDGSALSVTSGDVLEVIQHSSDAEGSILYADSRYFISVADFTLGTEFVATGSTLNINDITWVPPSSIENADAGPRVEITISGLAADSDEVKAARPNSYVEIDHFPSEAWDNKGVKRIAANVDATGTTIELNDVENIAVGDIVTLFTLVPGDALTSNASVATTYTDVKQYSAFLQVRVASTTPASNTITIDDSLDTLYNESGNIWIEDAFVGIGNAITSRFFIPPNRAAVTSTGFDSGSGDLTIVLESDRFATLDGVKRTFYSGWDDLGDENFKLKMKQPYWRDITDGAGTGYLVDTIDPSISISPAKLSAVIGLPPSSYDNLNFSEDQFLEGYKGLAGPLRVAKFLVTAVDAEGSITSLRVLDRGVYKVFPSDLTFGLPLEYDIETPGGSFGAVVDNKIVQDASMRSTLLGVVDPLYNNVEFGPPANQLNEGHPEYAKEPFRETDNRHPDWYRAPEFYYNGREWLPYRGSAGAYDPSTWVIVNVSDGRTADIANLYSRQGTNWAAPANQSLLDRAYADGLLLRKSAVIETDPLSSQYGKYKEPRELSGGTGARLFVTAQEVPDCSEKGTAKEALGLPDIVEEINAPKHLAALLNDAIKTAGYTPEDLRVSVTPQGEISNFEIETNLPGVNIDSPTPGFLEKFGLPTGDYNLGILCIESVIQDPNVTDQEAEQVINDLYSSGAYGVLDEGELAELTGRPTDSIKNTNVLSLACVQRLRPKLGDRVVDFDLPSNDNTSVLGSNNIVRLQELYRYDVTNIFGDAVTLDTQNRRQNVNLNIFESRRYNDTNKFESVVQLQPADADTVVIAGQPAISTTNPLLPVVEKQWVDDYNGNGWAYLENGIVKRQQENLVDVNFIDNAIIYDGDTGNRITDLDFYDPFKGVLPGFINNEIDYISEIDPVGYNSARSVFGRNNIGRVWWDTSTVSYMWYEQGTNAERRNNWGSTFPGSSITICEWVESEVLPENWTGNGAPRWLDRWITERHQDATTGEFKLYYYYWIQNRTVVDDRIKRDLNRKLDTRTIARYISNPSKYGLDLISYISNDSFVLYNTGDDLNKEDNRVQINLSRNLNPDGLDHGAWKLIREADTKSIIPLDLSLKLIDSLCGENAIGQSVPDTRLSEVERYGVSFRPRQTMFRDVKEARRILVSTVNRILAELKLETQFPEWDSELPATRTYIQNVNWYAARYINNETNQPVRYDNSYKPVYKVASVEELYRLRNVPDGTVAQVSNVQNNSVELWLYQANTVRWNQISIQNETVKLSDAVFTDDTNTALSSEIRSLLTALRDRVFLNTNYWNIIFFELMKHAYTEQRQLSWAFKTSYLYIEKQEDDLVQFTGFRPDNFQRVLDYMNEVKPYNAKIREYKDGKRTPTDLIGQNNISDYDKPAYVDTATSEIRVLDEQQGSDLELMSNNARYVDYWTAYTSGNTDPIRKGNVNLTFDRTNWKPTKFDFDPLTENENYAVARNIAYLTQLSNEEVNTANDVRAIDRIFKFDTQVQATFIAEVNTYFDDVTAFSNASIVGNADVMYDVINSNNLDQTLALLKDKVGGNFRGETLNANGFQGWINEINYISDIITEFGFDAQPFDENTNNDTITVTDSRNEANYGNVTTIGVGDVPWDQTTEIVSYEGVLNVEQDGPVTLKRNDEVYEGFDGITFHKMLYGGERPEELAMFSPLENVVMTVVTSEFARGQTIVTSNYDPIPENANASVGIGNEGSIEHAGFSVQSANITNPGIGYVNPDVTFYNSLTNDVITDWAASAITDGNGSVTSFVITSAGAPSSQMSIQVDYSVDRVTGSTGFVGSNFTSFTNVTGIAVGQSATVTSTGEVLGIVVSIVGSLVTFDRTFIQDYSALTSITFEGRDFEANMEYGVSTSPFVYIDRAYAEEFLSGIVAYTIVSTTIVQVDSVDFVQFTRTAGTDPLESNNFYVVNSASGWDTANVDGEAGSFDLPTSSLEETIVQQVAVNSKEVRHRVHMDLFGGTDYLRLSDRFTTSLSEDLNIWSDELVVANDNTSDWILGTSLSETRYIWVGSELIAYGRKQGNKLDFLSRGAKGTTIENHPAGTPVYSSYNTELFNDLIPERNIWLEVGTRYEDNSQWDQAGDVTLGNQDDNKWITLADWDENSNVSLNTDTALITNSTNVSSNLNITSGISTVSGQTLRIRSQSAETLSLSNQFSQYETVVQFGSGSLSSNIVLSANVAKGDTTITFTGSASVNNVLVTEDGYEVGQIQTVGAGTATLFNGIEANVLAGANVIVTDIVNGMEMRDGANVIGFVNEIDYSTGNIEVGPFSEYIITNGTNINLYNRDVVRVIAADPAGPTQVITVGASYAPGFSGYLNRNLFNDSATVDVEQLVLGDSNSSWDSATIAGQTALSLADRANADYSSATSIMRFLHFGEDPD